MKTSPANQRSLRKQRSRSLVTSMIGCGLMFLLTNHAQAGSATWNVNPSSGDWNTPANWTPTTVPNGFGDVATFGFSNITDVFVSHPLNTQSDTVKAIIFSPAATNPYTITIPPGPLNLFVGGIVNTSGITQNFVVNAGPRGFFGELFVDGGTVGGSIAFTNNGSTSFNGGLTVFSGSSASDCTFINNGNLAPSGFANAGQTDFFLNATTHNGTFINNGGMARGTVGGATLLGDNSAAVSSTFTNNGGTVSGAEGGRTEFRGSSNAMDSTLIANGGTNGGQGGRILFEGKSTGETSRVEVFGNGNLDISSHFRSIGIGSIEGNGNVFLGNRELVIGSNNLSTIFEGVIQDGGQGSGTGGSLTKIGSGILALTGSNTYTGNTNVNGGVLQVDGSITSNTFINHGGTLAGTGTVNGNVTNRGTVSPGESPGILTIDGNYAQKGGALVIDIAGSGAGQFSVLDVLGNANLSGLLDPMLLDGFVPTIGESFTFLDCASLTGTLFIHDRNIDGAVEHWNVTYGSKGAILTAAPGNVSIPDRGPTFLLFTLSLLALVMYRRELPLKRLSSLTSC